MDEQPEDTLEIKDHLEKDVTDECGYCGQVFGPDFIVIERTIHGRKWHFCSEECLRDFQDASNFKDQDLDSKDPESPDLAAETTGVYEDEEEDGF